MLKKFSPVLHLTAGIDEVGRGALVGNVIAAAVILNSDNLINNLKDSKKLSCKQRLLLSSQIKKNR